MNKTGHAPRILVVDDEPIILETFKFIFGNRFELLTAATGKDALESISKDSVDLVFLDLSLPDMHGMQVLNAIKGHNNHLPVIIISGDDNQAMIREAQRLGAMDYIDKPFDIEQVLSIAQETLNKNK